MTLLAEAAAIAPVPLSPVAAIAIVAGLLGFGIGLVVMFRRRAHH